ncbi:MAG TPA: UDP-3-O-(3-hydroxymyristoyl)glucosamine N-acyltransferase [Burkholderiaceae bacterium]|nr:UDP-3-O-(3-hydroxymyristoyl)glucosamine N-acyltransferase [Burkholderiaceae bacterium]
MRFTLDDLCTRFGGRLLGDPSRSVVGFASIETAGAQHIAFVAQDKYLAVAAASRAGALIVRPAHGDALRSDLRTVWLHDQPYLAFARISQYMVQTRSPRKVLGIHPSAVVAADARVAEDVNVGPNAVIGAGCVIGLGTDIGPGCVLGEAVHVGADCLLHANVSVYDGTVMGDRCIVHAGAVIGSDGFGLAPDRGAWVKIPQVGRVLVGNDVEIGANTTIDRGALDDTVIGDGVKLDNQIQIAHNVRIGEHTAIAACVGIAGSTTIGKRCTFGGAAMVVGHIEIGDDVHVSGGALVAKSIHTPGRYSGSFPIDTHRGWERNAAVLRNLADLRERVRELEREAREERAGTEKKSS